MVSVMAYRYTSTTFHLLKVCFTPVIYTVKYWCKTDYGTVVLVILQEAKNNVAAKHRNYRNPIIKDTFPSTYYYEKGFVSVIFSINICKSGTEFISHHLSPHIKQTPTSSSSSL